MAKRVKKKVESECTAIISLLGRKYTAKGETAKDAIANLVVGNATKGKAVLTIQKGDLSKDKILNPRQVFRLFTSSRLMREVALKNVSMMFDGF